MKSIVFFTLFVLAVLADPTTVIPQNPEFFSQIIGATTAVVDGSTLSAQGVYLPACLDYIASYPSFSTIPADQILDIEQVALAPVCKLCTSISLSRVDSCCTGTDTILWESCFAKFGLGVTAAGTAPAANTATATSKSAPATNEATITSGAGLLPAATTKSSSGSTPVVVDMAGSILAMLGFAIYLLF